MNVNHFSGFDKILDSEQLSDSLERFIDALPHGSGINYTWGGYLPKSGQYVYFTNAYDVMNENGFYIGVQQFTLRLDRSMFLALLESASMARRYMHIDSKIKQEQRVNILLGLLADDMTIQYNGGDYFAEYYMLKDYLWETIHYTLSESVYSEMVS